VSYTIDISGGSINANNIVSTQFVCADSDSSINIQSNGFYASNTTNIISGGYLSLTDGAELFVNSVNVANQIATLSETIDIYGNVKTQSIYPVSTTDPMYLYNTSGSSGSIYLGSLGQNLNIDSGVSTCQFLTVNNDCGITGRLIAGDISGAVVEITDKLISPVVVAPKLYNRVALPYCDMELLIVAMAQQFTRFKM
jgi:hypothetical protein